MLPVSSCNIKKSKCLHLTTDIIKGLTWPGYIPNMWDGSIHSCKRCFAIRGCQRHSIKAFPPPHFYVNLDMLSTK